MASSKKPTTARKKTAASSAKPAKKVAPRKPAAKRAPAKSRSATTVRRTTAAPKTKSFRRSQPERPFMSFQLTNQTFYWLILGGIVVALGVWIITLHNQVQDIYDQIDQHRADELNLIRSE